ncbi:uncharacterized protein LOC132700318 [Cylas formicarius]|uniref:uncharacterized protein LOC132700318 n=1 Tax=Cylas formicarius TaxID=197179 RepID=UPI0029585E4A|nr:uncharacterized protein LOC132700318 [Cylas formicarius]
MWLRRTWLPLLIIGMVLIYNTEARRIRVQRPLQQEEADETVQYYAAEPQDEQLDPRQRVVLVSSADQYNGLYGQPTASSRSAQDNYIPRGSTKSHEASYRTKEPTKSPPVQTIRNYSKVNDDGSFTFGYEAADGSFKEETRGTDCVVRGKYGYVDPDGNKREFTYVSGNPCDPNAPKEEEEEVPEEESNDNANLPANYPTRPVRPIHRPVSAVTAKPVSLFQTNYEQSEDEQPEPEQILRPTPTPVRQQYFSRPQYIQTSAAQADQIYQRPRTQTNTPAPSIYRQSPQPVSITPRPQVVSATTATRTQLPATTYRPQLLQVAVTPRPSLLYTKQLTSQTATAAPNKQVDFDSEFQRFNQENLVSPTAITYSQPVTAKPQSTLGQIYSSALVYDPASGQYKNQLYQSLPQTEGDFTLTQRIQPYVYQPQSQRTTLQQTAQRPKQANPQAVYQAQQAEQLFQSSAQLYAQQQKARAQQQQQQRQAPPVYYVQPSVDQTGALGTSQIDAFLRGHNIQF